MKKSICLFLVCCGFLFHTTRQEMCAQDDEFKVNIFGNVVSNFYAFTKNNEPYLQNGNLKSTFLLQQANLYLSGNVASDWKYFIEFTFQAESGPSTQAMFHAHQAWVEYRPSDEFGLRIGRALCQFGLFNAIHSRPALYWMVFRPLPYEETHLTSDEVEGMRSEFNNGLMVSGVLPVSSGVKIDYNAYVGNTENVNGLQYDLSSTKKFGARVAVRTENITLGISPAFNNISAVDDVAQRNSFLLALDATVKLGNFTLISEYVSAARTYSALPGTTGYNSRNYVNNTDQFIFTSLGYELNEKWLVFGGFESFWTNNPASAYVNKAQTSLDLGANFRASERILLKADISHHLFTTTARPTYQSLALSAVVSF